jgi:AcrR family transcriptional regulator
MVNSAVNTEQKILTAAKTVFHRRGFEGARMQEIADEAGVNKALLHYYFRSKEILFEAVFEDAFSQLMARMKSIFLSEEPLQGKIETFIDYYINFLSHHSFLPIFILNSMHTRPEQLKTLMGKVDLSPAQLLQHIARQAKAEHNLTLDPFHLYVNVLSLCIFPVLARPVIQTIFGKKEEDMKDFFEERKRLVPEFVINAIRGYSQRNVEQEKKEQE